MENKEKKTVELKKASPVIKTLLSTMTINLRKNEKKKKKKKKYYKKIGIKKCEIFWGCLVCKFGTLAKIVPYSAAFPYSIIYPSKCRIGQDIQIT